MPHSVQTKSFGRNKSWRKATVRSLAQALVKQERIETTWTKAKETQKIAERLITLGKNGSVHARRRAQSILNDVEGVRKLFTDIAPRFQNRAGGYTRVLHLGHRAGDGADMAWIELVELGAKFQAKPKGKEAKGKEKPKAKTETKEVKEKPASREAKPVKEERAPKSETRAAEPAAEAEKPSESPKKAVSPEQKKQQPGGMVDGLRKFFKRRGDAP